MVNQKLIIISGSPCVGKTTVADKLFQSYENSAYLDGDWCWCINPFSLSDPRLRNGDKSVSFVLSNYLNSDFDYVIFSSVVVMYESIRKPILEDITARDFDIIGFTLTCSEETLAERHKNRGDENEVSFHWLHLPLYPGDYVVNTEGKTVEQIVDEIRELIDSGGRR
ncbi:MAG: AAA family ATPase [Clostridia bacterium]|nr:AAA family ATPase [Clostridia bacterium]